MRLLSYYLPTAPKVLVYMLQQVEYDPEHFLKWVKKAPSLRSLRRRGDLVLTSKAKILLLLAYGTWLVAMVAGVFYAFTGMVFGLVLIASAPVLTAGSLAIVAWLGQGVLPGVRKKEFELARKKIAAHRGVKIAVIGSYGKTTMKELLYTVLSEGRRVAATPGNKNVAISHARWINAQVTGAEDVLIFEYGEAKPGDIEELASISSPDMAIITGLAPAHMDGYGSLNAIAEDFRTVAKHVPEAALYVNAESELLNKHAPGYNRYGIEGADGWRVSNIKASIEGTSFTLSKKSQRMTIQSKLLGLHQVGPLAVVAAIADTLGLDKKQIEQGLARTAPFEHRMSTYRLSGAWVIDDTYNGNIEGMKAGLTFLAELQAKGRKIYVTPGLVEQGELTQHVHNELGRHIAAAQPDVVVLMNNSAEPIIQAGLNDGGFQGELRIENDPLAFYTNLNHFIAAGDIVLMQNDWTDNYS